MDIREKGIRKMAAVIYGFITGDGNIGSRMASSSPNAQDVYPPEIMSLLEGMAADLQKAGIETLEDVTQEIRRRTDSAYKNT